VSVLQIPSRPEPVETVAMFWAHYDDDLVFANPTLLHALDGGHHAHSFFFTASDAGTGMSDYMNGRESGIRAAYDTMRGAAGPWSDRTVVLANGVTVTVTRPDGDDRVSLSFLRLPDGGVRGGGYAATGWQSLAKLVSGEIPSLRTLDTGQAITLPLLRTTVAHLVLAHNAAKVISHSPGFDDGPGDDHPDHQSVGRVVASVVDAGHVPAGTVQYAVGYPGAQRPANIDPEILARKLEAFASYAAWDPVVAREHVHEYLQVRGFGEWLQRHYLEPHSGPIPVVPDAPELVGSSAPHVLPRPDATDATDAVGRATPRRLARPGTADRQNQYLPRSSSPKSSGDPRPV
jgi:LmbE family N-acetylglucosaminyl deacetylase